MIKKGFKYVCQFCLLLFISIGLLSFYKPKKINAGSVGGNSPIIGVNISAISFDYEKIFEYTDLEFKDNGAYWDCVVPNSNPCPTWRSGLSNGNYQLEYNIDHGYTESQVMVYQYEFILNDFYVGSVTFSSAFNIDSQLNQSHQAKQYFVNGNSFTISGSKYVGSWTVSSYNLTQKDLVDLSTIENLLTDIDTNTDNLELYTNNIYNYLRNRFDFNFPIESYTFISSLYRRNYTVLDYDSTFRYQYPIFNLTNEQYLVYNYYVGASHTGRNEIILIIGSNQYINTIDRFKNFFSITNESDFSITYEQLYFTYNNNYNYIFSLKFTNNNTSGKSLTIQSLNNNNNIMPIYLNYTSNKNISTDFALTFGLTNDLLDNLNIIANGNSQSNQSSSSADSTNQQLQSATSQEEQLVSNAENDMQQNLNNLNIVNQNNNLFGNSKFIGSANWVKQQFDYFTNNNAYGYLITFSLVIGISLVIIGKLRG